MAGATGVKERRADGGRLEFRQNPWTGHRPMPLQGYQDAMPDKHCGECIQPDERGGVYDAILGPRRVVFISI